VIDFLVQNIDDFGVPVVAALALVWNVCRARRMTKATPLVDRIPIVLATIGAAGLVASYVKWVDVGQWPLFLYLAGTVGWNAMPNLRHMLIGKLDQTRRAHRIVRQAVGIRE
jgi:hypothetical protein